MTEPYLHNQAPAYCTLEDLERDAERYRRLPRFANVESVAAATSSAEATRRAVLYCAQQQIRAVSAISVELPPNWPWYVAVWMVEAAAKSYFIVNHIIRYRSDHEHGYVVVLANDLPLEVDAIIEGVAKIKYVEPAAPASHEETQNGATSATNTRQDYPRHVRVRSVTTRLHLVGYSATTQENYV